MTEEDISKAFSTLGQVAGIVEGLLWGLKSDPVSLAGITEKINQIADFMSEGAKAIRELENIKNHPGYNVAQISCNQHIPEDCEITEFKEPDGGPIKPISRKKVKK